MHEAGLARAIAHELRERALTVGAVRVLVKHGHDEPCVFDAALRAHLAAEVPGGGEIEIVHVPAQRVCASCARSFEAVGAADPCPVCCGASLPATGREKVEIELR